MKMPALPLCFLGALCLSADTLFSLLPLGFLSPSFTFRPDLLADRFLHLFDYSFTEGVGDLVLLLLLRSLLLISLFLLGGRPTPRRIINNVSFILASASIPFCIVKLLAFAEVPAQLAFPGVWALVSWSIVASVLSRILCVSVLAAFKPESRRLTGNSDSESDSLTASSEADSEAVDDEETEVEDGGKRMSTWAHVCKLGAYSLKQWRLLGTAFLCLIGYTAVVMLIPHYVSIVIANVVHSRGYSELLTSAGILALLTIACSFFDGGRYASFDMANAMLGKQIRQDLFRSLVRQDIAFFDGTKTGEIVSRLTSDCETISDAISIDMNVFARNAVLSIGTLLFMFHLSWQLTLVTFVILVPLALINQAFATYFDRTSEELQSTIANANQKAEEVLSTMRTVRSFACEELEATLFERLLKATLNVGRRRAIAHGFEAFFNVTLGNGCLIPVLVYGGHLVIKGRLSSDYFISFVLYQMKLDEYLYELGWVVTEVMKSVGASRKVFQYMHRKPRIANNGNKRPAVRGDISIDNISFTYPSRPHNPVIKGLSLNIRAGETVAFVGPSGGGKSSIISLLQRFYEADSGRILLDGEPISHFDHGFYHQKVALVAQEPVLYDGSISSNIAYGCEWADDKEIRVAATAANADCFVRQLERGYDTNCGERGAQMSGGQKQRIAIARALVRKPAVLVLDEATSALDSESELLVQDAINTCAGQCTILIIAHRLSTIKKADRIVVIDKGSIVQIGNHSELMEDRAGLYHGLVSRQVATS